MQGDRQTFLRVGAFVVVALVIFGSLVFIIGNQSGIFAPKSTYYVNFDNVQGLREGSPVRIAGVSVGTVSNVSFMKDGKVRTTLEIADSVRHLVRKGSVASVGSKGLLGDKVVDVSVGTGEQLAAGATIPASGSKGLSDYMEAAGTIMADAKKAMDNLRRASEPFGEPQFADSVRQTTSNAARITDMAANGKGTVHRLLADPALARSFGELVDNMKAASSELQATSKSVRGIAQEVQSGNGSAHAIIYGEDGKRMVKNFADAAGEVSTLLGQVRKGEGTMHDVIYGQGGNELIANLTDASKDIKAITSDIRAGKGTIGALVEDPSVYDDVKRLLGDLQRNEILRALVRYSIKHDETMETPAATPAGN